MFSFLHIKTSPCARTLISSSYRIFVQNFHSLNENLINKVNRFDDNIMRIGRNYLSVITFTGTSAFTNGTKIRTNIPVNAATNHACQLILSGNFGNDFAFIRIQFYKPSSGINASFCKAASINSFKPEIKLGIENGLLVIVLTDKTYNYHSFYIDAFVPSGYTDAHMSGWTVVNDGITAPSPVTVIYTN